MAVNQVDDDWNSLSIKNSVVSHEIKNVLSFGGNVYNPFNCIQLNIWGLLIENRSFEMTKLRGWA